jgi:hypothetical protein
VLLDDLTGHRVDRHDIDTRQKFRVLNEQGEAFAQRFGQRVGVGGEENPAVLGTPEQVLHPVQGDDGLACAGTAGDLCGAGVRGPVGHPPLCRVQEDPPGRERLGEHVLQLTWTVPKAYFDQAAAIVHRRE